MEAAPEQGTFRPVKRRLWLQYVWPALPALFILMPVATAGYTVAAVAIGGAIVAAGSLKPWGFIRYPTEIEILDDRLRWVCGAGVCQASWSEVRRVSVFRRRGSTVIQLRLTCGWPESLLVAIRHMAFKYRQGDDLPFQRIACDSEMEGFADLMLRVQENVDRRLISDGSLFERIGLEL